MKGLAVAGTLLAIFGIPMSLTLAAIDYLKADLLSSFFIGLFIGFPFGIIGRIMLYIILGED